MPANQGAPSEELIQEWKDDFNKNYVYEPDHALRESQRQESATLAAELEASNTRRIKRAFEQEKLNIKWSKIHDDARSKQKAQKLIEWLESKGNEYREKEKENDVEEDLIHKTNRPIKMADVPLGADIGIEPPLGRRTEKYYWMLKCRWCKNPPKITNRNRMAGYRHHLKQQHSRINTSPHVSAARVVDLFGTKIEDATDEWYQERMG